MEKWVTALSAVLGAIRDAEDALARFATDQQRELALQRAVTPGKSSVDIAVEQYRVGLSTYINVLSAEANYLSAVDQLQQSREALATDLVSLYKVLGGGWEEIQPTKGKRNSAFETWCLRYPAALSAASQRGPLLRGSISESPRCS